MARMRYPVVISPYHTLVPQKAWYLSFIAQEIHYDSYLTVAVEGAYGREGAYAALRVDEIFVGASDRSVSFPSNSWEAPVKDPGGNYTYYFPMNKKWEGKKIDVFVLETDKNTTELHPVVWQMSKGIPYEEQILELIEQL